MKKITATLILSLMMALTWVPAAEAVTGNVNCGTSGTYHVAGTVVDTSDHCVGSVTFDDSITEIAENALGNYPGQATNANISEINFGSNSSLEIIGPFAFYNSIGTLNQLHVPNSVTMIDRSAFRVAVSLQTLTLGNSVETLGEEAFGQSTVLTSVELPHSLVTVGANVFDGSGITSLRIPNSIGVHAGSPLGTIPSSAFQYMDALTSVYIEDGVGVISSYAFGDDRNLADIRLPETLTEIEELAFTGVQELTEIRIPNSVTAIGDEAFFSSGKVERIYIGSGLRFLGQSVFGSDWAPAPNVLTCLTNSSVVSAEQLFAAGIEIPVPACEPLTPPVPIVAPRVERLVSKVESLSGRSMSTSGGETLTIWGENLSQVTSVSIGGISVKLISKSENALAVEVPPNAAGFADLVIISPTLNYTYQNAIQYKTPAIHIGLLSTSKTIKMLAKAKSFSIAQKKLIAVAVNSVESPTMVTCTVIYSKANQSKAALSAAKELAQSACKYAKKLHPQLVTTAKAIASKKVLPNKKNLVVSARH